MEFDRREFLQLGAVSTVSVPLLARRAEARSTPEEVGEELISQLSGVVSSLAQIAEEWGEQPRKPLLDSAVEIGEPYQEVTGTLGVSNIHQLEDVETVSDPVGNVIFKTLRVCREYFGLNVDVSSYAGYLFKISSLGGVLFGVSAVGESAYKLFEANTKRGISREKIDGQLFRDYVLSIVGLALEIALIPVPFSYKPAWRGTRFIANRSLLRVRRYANGRYADAVISVAMSILHWAQRGFINNSLTDLSGSVNFVEDVAARVEEQATSIRLDCSLKTEADEIAGVFDLLDVSPKNLFRSLSTFIDAGEASLDQLAVLVGDGLQGIGFDLEGN